MARAGAVRGILLKPEEFDWDRSTFFAHLIDGYRLAQQEGFGDLRNFYPTILAEAERTGT